MRRSFNLQFAIRNLQFAILLLAVAGCQRADHFGPLPRPAAAEQKPPSDKPKETPPPSQLSWDIRWEPPNLDLQKPDLPIEFVHEETDREEWRKLPAFWNAPPLGPEQAAAKVGMAIAAGPLATLQGAQPVKIKVPLGLDDPRPYVPASNPLTLRKWELGQRLFFDTTYLTAKDGVSCAGCHKPENAYTDRKKGHQGVNTPTLVNSVYNTSQFWDGRAAQLEEVVQRTLEDEQEGAQSGEFRHVWGGVIKRLRKNRSYVDQFESVFGCGPTQDTVGRALATYMRTLLAGNSLHDRALAEKAKRRAPALEVSDYEAVLDASALKTLGREGKAKETAAELFLGYRLFHNIGERRAYCVKCHGGRTFTDGQFYNLGVGWKFRTSPSSPTGRLAHAPVGQMDPLLDGAYKTPTLRSLTRTSPYFHDGNEENLKTVIKRHVSNEITFSPAPVLIDLDKVRLSDAELDALVLFLNALNGDDIDPILKSLPPSG
jgi:cytochrome c peroxidase